MGRLVLGAEALPEPDMTRLGAWALHFAAQVVSKPSVNKFTPNLKSQFYSLPAAHGCGDFFVRLRRKESV